MRGPHVAALAVAGFSALLATCDDDREPSRDAAETDAALEPDAADAAAPDSAPAMRDAGGELVPPPCVPPSDPEACNGSRALCERRFDQVSYATTHNAMSIADEGWALPNQQHDLRRQLDDGIRALMLDVHEGRSGPLLCHGLCAAGMKPLSRGLSEIRAFLDCRPRDVVTIIFESNVPAAEIEDAFETSGLAELAHAQPRGGDWPTLAEMIASGRRLVVFTDEDPGEPAWYHDAWAYTWQNAYAAESADDFTCVPDRGDPDAPLFVLNHFLTAPFASRELAEQVNHDPFLRDRVLGCWAEVGARPSFVTVDFYDIGDVLELVDELNAMP